MYGGYDNKADHPDLDFAMIEIEDGTGTPSEPAYPENTPNVSSEPSAHPFTNQTWPFDASNIQDNIQFASSMSRMVNKGRQAWTFYGNIDILRPYFDVEPYDVLKRLATSLVPLKPTTRQKVAKELYGPLMVVFTLIALLLYQMKSSDRKVEEGTLMGTAFGVSFTYWIGSSSFVWFMSFVCNVSVTFVQVMSMLGYALFGHCIVLLLSTLIHTSHDHMFFYVLWGIIGGLSALKLASILISRTTGYTQRVIICTIVTALHMSYLLYLHFAYHQIVEDISEALQSAVDGRQIIPDITVALDKALEKAS